MDGDETIPSDHDKDTSPSSEDVSLIPDDFTLQAPSFAEIDDSHFAVVTQAVSFQIVDADMLPHDFGKYRLEEIVGEGGAGLVFKGKRIADAESDHAKPVAIKVIRPEIMANSRVVQRFEKESRILASIDSPFVTQFIEFGKEAGVFYIVSEFVEGVCLSDIVAETKSLPGKVSLRLVADLLKAISEIHSAGAIHRDIKPGNVIVAFDSKSSSSQTRSVENFSVAKLTDFGLARQLDQSESMDMTRQQAMMGTPLYMAPEQFTDSRSVDARADIYSVGVTLYQLIAGKGPFIANDALELAEKHRIEAPLPLTMVRPDISDAISQVALKALEKRPDMRYQTAAEMLADIERILDDRPTSIHAFPQAPKSESSSAKNYVFQWTLNATPRQLWPLVADTDRFNRAIGLPAPEFSFDHSGDERKIFATALFMGMKIRWREHPFQWNSGRELSVLREFESGPFEWVTNTVELHPVAGNSTRIVHKFHVQPRGMMGKLITPLQFGLMTRKGLEKAYARMEKIAQNDSCGYACDFSFGKTPKLNQRQRALIENRSIELGQKIGNSARASLFGDYLQTVADPFVAKIRPIVLADRLGCSVDHSLALCFHAIESSLLSLYWDLICPICRISAGNVSTLEMVQNHAHCSACNKGFEVDFTKSVEAVFCISDELRKVEQKTYCIGGPFHSPHILAQNHLQPEQQVEFEADVMPGSYDVSAPQFDRAPSLRVSEDALLSRAQFLFGVQAESPHPVQAGTVCVSIGNRSDRDILVRFQQRAELGDAFSAAAAFEHALFSKLMPKDLLSPDQLVGQTTAYLLTIRLADADQLADEIGDIQLRESWKVLQKLISESAKTVCASECCDEMMVVPFTDLEEPSRFVAELTDQFLGSNSVVANSCFGITSGQIMSCAQGNQLTMFGKAVREAKAVVDGQGSGVILVAKCVWDELPKDDPFGTMFVKDEDPLVLRENEFVRLKRAW